MSPASSAAQKNAVIARKAFRAKPFPVKNKREKAVAIFRFVFKGVLNITSPLFYVL
jgi:hypothetical protein